MNSLIEKYEMENVPPNTTRPKLFKRKCIVSSKNSQAYSSSHFFQEMLLIRVKSRTVNEENKKKNKTAKVKKKE